MKKIPVGATIARTYRFLLKDFVALAGLIWLPWLLFYMLPIGLLMMWELSHPPSPLATGLSLLVNVAMCVGMAIQMTGACRLALGLRTKRVFFYLAMDKITCRVALAYIGIMLAFIILLAAFVAFAIFGYAVISALGNASALAGRIVAALLAILYIVAVPCGFCGLIYLFVRSTCVQTAACIDGADFGVKRSWKLASGNFWRALIVFLSAWLLPFVIIMGLEIFALVKPLSAILNDPATQASLKVPGGQQILQAAMIRVFLSHWYILLPAGLLVSILTMSLLAGGQAFAYRALAESETIPNPL